MKKNLIPDSAVYTLHKWFGLIAGLFMLMLSITGVMLVFNDEIDTVSNSELVQVQPGDARLSADQLVAALVQKYPDASLNSTYLYPDQPDRAVMTELNMDRKSWWVYQHPATGAVLGQRERNETFMKKVLHLHEHLTLGSSGHVVLFLVGISLLGLVITGLWYYRKSLLSVFKVGVRSKNAYLINSDLHKLTGVVSFVFLLLMGGTGTFMHWEKVERMLDGAGGPPPPAAPAAAPAYTQLSLQSSIQKAAGAVKDFVPAQIRYPKTADGTVTIAGTRPESNRLLGLYPTSVEINPASGEVAKITHLEDRDLEANAEATMEQIHFGHYGGVFIQLLYGLGGIALGAMTVTGFVVWWKKRKPKKKAKRAMKMA